MGLQGVAHAGPGGMEAPVEQGFLDDHEEVEGEHAQEDVAVDAILGPRAAALSSCRRRRSPESNHPPVPAGTRARLASVQSRRVSSSCHPVLRQRRFQRQRSKTDTGAGLRRLDARVCDRDRGVATAPDWASITAFALASFSVILVWVPSASSSLPCLDERMARSTSLLPSFCLVCRISTRSKVSWSNS